MPIGASMSATSLPRKRGERMAAPKRVWLYGRIHRGGTSQVLDCQMEHLRGRAKEQGWVITREIRSGVFPDRPGLREVTQAAADGRMDDVVVKSMTRLCRNSLDAYVYMKRLQELGVGLVSIKDQVMLTASSICLQQ